ncbi:MAG: outer membrane protein assembly factor BamA [Acidobacteriota bacterium]
MVAGQKIMAIEVQGLKTLAEDSLLFYLGLKRGAAVDPDRLNANLHALWERHLVDDVRVDSVPVEGGVKLIIHVQERPVLRSIKYDGLKRIGSTDINDRILKERINAREGQPLDLGELNRLKVMLEDMYKEKGYRFAEVKYALEDAGPGEKRVRFTVDEGDRVRIQKITFIGNTVHSGFRLRWTMRKTKETSLLWRILKFDIYNPATMREDLDRVRDLYRRDGYKDALVADPLIEARALRPGAMTPKQKKRRLFVSVPITEGKRWKLGQVSIEGAKAYKEDLLLRAFRRRSGGWLRSKAIADAVEKVSDTYRNTGFIEAHVEPEIRESGPDTADVIVHVNEGDQYRVGRIEFSGNTRTHDKVLRRELRVQEGMLLNIGGLKNSVYKINQLQFFKLNQDDPIEFANFDTEKKTVDLQVKGDESDRTQLEVGGGYSEQDKFFAQVSVRTQNFLGRGEQAGVSVQTGGIRNVYDLSYFVPWFLDRPQSVGIQLQRYDYNYNLLTGQTLIDNTRGAVLTYGRNFGLFNSASISYSYSKVKQVEQIDITGQTITPVEIAGCTVGVSGTTYSQDCRRNVSLLRPAYAYESLDSRFEPTRGTRLHASLDLAGGALGGETEYLKPEFGVSWFHPLANYPVRSVLGLNVEGGTIRPYGKNTLLYNDYYFLGGENSIRGFAYRQLWLRNSKGEIITDAVGAPLGGSSYIQANAEYHFLLGGPFRLLLFADAGNMFGCDERLALHPQDCQDSKFRVSDMRYTAGAELRIFVPVLGAPLRFIYASNLRPKPGDKFDHFLFSIGTSF